jgi:hypothetical protein
LSAELSAILHRDKNCPASAKIFGVSFAACIFLPQILAGFGILSAPKLKEPRRSNNDFAYLEKKHPTQTSEEVPIYPKVR